MTCWSVNRRGTSYVDGRLRGSELSRVEAHLSECQDCELRINEIRSVRSTLRELPKAKIPRELSVRLRVKASQERLTMLETDGSTLLRIWNNWKFRIDAMMRPLTIPATGGILSSVILFGALAFTIGTTTRGVAYDVPVFYGSRMDARLVPLELRSSVVLTLSLDGNGHITDYAVRGDSSSFVGNATRLENISVPEFPSVMAIAQPISSDIRISFIPIVFRP